MSLQLEFAGSGMPIARVACDATTTWQDVYDLAKAKVWNEYTYELKMYKDHALEAHIAPSSDHVMDEVVKTVVVLRCTEKHLPTIRHYTRTNAHCLLNELVTPLSETRVKHLLAAKARLDVTAGACLVLHRAIYCQSLGVMKLLLDAKANVNQHPPSGCTALAYCVIRNRIHAARLLVEAKADPKSRMDSKESPLDLASQYGSKDMLAFLESL